MEQRRGCNGEHRFHVADVATVVPEGTVSVIALGLYCGHTQLTTHKVVQNIGSNITLSSTEKLKKENENESI
jgi:hypothetical protein